MGKRLGQHFLKNARFLDLIAGALKLNAGETVIEVGPGHGELTRAILKTPEVSVIAIERDALLARQLREGMGDKRVEVVEGDILKVLPQLISRSANQLTNYKLVGNIPFYLTGRLLRTLGELERKPTRAVLTIQREVGERVVAGAPHMNLLAATVQFWAHAHLAAPIPRNAFSPPPKVDAAILVLVPHEPNGDPQRYYPLVRTLFKQPRKTVLNNLSSSLGKGEGVRERTTRILLAAGINPSNRPHHLSLEHLRALAAREFT